MNDVLATLLALGLLYLVVKFAFGGPAASSSAANNREPIPAHEQANVAAARNRAGGAAASSATSSSWMAGSSGGKKETLISRYGLEGRLGSSLGQGGASADDPSGGASQQATLPPGGSSGSKGKGKMQNDLDWKNGAEGRRQELKRRKEEMILEARR